MRVTALYWWMVGLAIGCLIVAGAVFATGRYWGFPLDYAEGEDLDLFLLCLPPLSATLGSAAHGLSTRSAKKRQRRISKRAAVLLALPILAFLGLFVAIAMMFHLSNLPSSTSYFTSGEFKGWVTSLVAGFICAMTYVLANLENRS